MKPLIYYTTAELTKMRAQEPEGSKAFGRLTEEIIERRESDRRLRAVYVKGCVTVDNYAHGTPIFIHEMEVSGFLL